MKQDAQQAACEPQASIVHEFLCGGWFYACGMSFCGFWGCGVIFRVVVWMGRGCVW